MLLRGGVRNDPRVLKEARTLTGAGCSVAVVAMKLPGEDRPVERMDRRLVAVRTTTGVVVRIRRLLGGRRADAEGRETVQATPVVPAAGRIHPLRLALMLVSRTLLALKMTALALRTRPDVVHAHDFNTLAAGWLTARLARVPLVYDAHEVNLDREGYYRQLRGLIRCLEGFLIVRCDRVITTTSLRARHFRRVYGLSRTPVVLQNRPPYQPPAIPRPLRHDLGIPDTALLCIYQGGLQAGRGLRNMIHAVGQAQGVHCVLLGGGHQARMLRELVDELGIADRVHFHGQVPLGAVAGITAAADVGMQVLRNTCFNHWSTDSNKLFEYALAGIAVIASDFPEIRNVVREHRIGLLIDPDSVESIAAALIRLRDDGNLLAGYKRQALAAASALSWSSQAPTLLAAYRDMGVPLDTDSLQRAS